MRGVIHIGAHRFEEYEMWKSQGATVFLLFEPISANVEYLKAAFPVYLTWHLALANYRGEATMYVDGKHNYLSASMLQPKAHLQEYPDVLFEQKETVPVDKLDWIIYDRSNYDHMHIAAQGMELEILKGGEESLKSIDTISCQVYQTELYKGCPLMEDIIAHLKDFDFQGYSPRGKNWGFASFKRKQNGDN
jgi:hypothetical protein